MNKEAFERVTAAGQLPWEDLHPINFVHHPDTPEENKRIQEKWEETKKIMETNSHRPPGSSYF